MKTKYKYCEEYFMNGGDRAENTQENRKRMYRVGNNYVVEMFIKNDMIINNMFDGFYSANKFYNSINLI